MLCTVLARNRTVLVDEKYTLGEIKDYIESKNMKFSLRRTLQFYGLKYVDDRAFTSKYKQEFNLSDTKKVLDIKLHELRIYKDNLIGHRVDWYRSR